MYPSNYKIDFMLLLKRGMDFIFPPSCLSCHRRVGEHGALCGKCWQEVRFIERPYCDVLGTPFEFQLKHDQGNQLQSAEAIAHPPSFSKARAVACYDPVVRKLISRLKFQDQSELAPWMAKWMVRAGKELLQDNVLIIPIPLHRKRQFWRRYNQSAELARFTALQADLPFEPELLMRVKATRQQVGLGKKQRQRNVMGAFQVPKMGRGKIKAAKILLIDDVFTTGSTLEAASRALLRAGAQEVNCLTFARVVRET